MLGHFLETFLDTHDLGVVYGADGTIRLMPGLVRIPDLTFVRWERLPGRELPAEPIPDLIPDLAVEVLSASNTAKEMTRKLDEYFRVGVRLVWLIDPPTHTAEVYTAPGQRTILSEEQALEGGPVLPGFSLSLRRLFDRAGRQRAPSRQFCSAAQSRDFGYTYGTRYGSVHPKTSVVMVGLAP